MRRLAILALLLVACAAKAEPEEPRGDLPDGFSLGRCLPPIIARDDLDKLYYVVRCESGAIIFIPREVLDRQRRERSREDGSNT